VVDVLRIQNAENASLKQRVSELETRLDELGNELSSQKADEEQIEAGLQGVFDMLDQIDTSNDSNENGSLESENTPDVNENNSDTESSVENAGSNYGAQTSDDNPSPDSDKSDVEPIPNDEINHPNKSEDPSPDDAHTDDDRFQSEFDIF